MASALNNCYFLSNPNPNWFFDISNDFETQIFYLTMEFFLLIELN